MSLRLYNTLTRTKEPFAPLDPKNVRLYVCGPTVYDFAHIGNARPVIVFDVLFRLLRHLYGESHVTYVRNITDIDDKINARAKERLGDRNVPILDVVKELTTETARIYDEDVAALGCLRPDEEPRATKHVPQMIAMIETLVANGHAYAAEGHVLYDVSSKPDYGKLSRRSLDEMMAGARVEVAPYKRNAMDFVLWKPSDAETPGWDSPWGRGRPGWHIECSAMSAQYLGETFDIHGGGIDLMFPHHENEIAQSESAHHNHPLAKVWMHNGFLNVEGEKMSKSLGNFVTIHELLDEYPGGALRFAMLQTHYRQPINWTESKVDDSLSELRDWVGMFENSSAESDTIMRRERGIAPVPHPSVVEALKDDLNTPEVITALRDLASTENSYSSLIESCEFLGIFDGKTIGAYFRGVSGKNLGYETTFKVHESVQRLKVAIINRDDVKETWMRNELLKQGVTFEKSRSGDVRLMPSAGATYKVDEIAELIKLRDKARKDRNFKEADRIRDELKARGIELRDNPDGTTDVDFS